MCEVTFVLVTITSSWIIFQSQIDKMWSNSSFLRDLNLSIKDRFQRMAKGD